MKKGFVTCIIIMALLASTGCGGKGTPGETGNSPETPATDSSAKESSSTPAGVTNEFFAAFFSGQDAEAFALLTPQAQEATQSSFSADASDTIRWTVGETEINDTTATVYVHVNDLNDEGNMASETLAFTLRNCEKQWRIAGFSTEGLLINFESQEITSSTPDMATEEEIKVGQLPDAPVLK
ncbi:MAG: hypothetical protein Q4G68_04730 [Planctomycetia bacterium]|nr:hypothetical protein [Planctomycetia bacterium]